MIRTTTLVLLSAAALLLGGCVAASGTKNLGKGIRESHEITRKYRALTIEPGYHYYYSGTELNPDAIMGLDKRYTVQSKFWHQVDLTREQLDYWVTWGDRQMADEGFSSSYLGNYMGASILDPEGRVVGDWYSKKDWGIFDFPGNDVIIPYPPRNRVEQWRRF